MKSRNYAAFLSLLIPLTGTTLCTPLALGQERIDSDVPVYSTEEAIQIRRGELKPAKPYYIIDFQGDYEERQKSIASQTPPPGAAINLGNLQADSRILEGSEAAAMATGLFLDQLVFQVGNGSDSNIELLAISMGISNDEARLLADFAKNETSAVEQLIKDEKSAACNAYATSRNTKTIEEISDAFKQSNLQISSKVNAEYYEIFLALADTLPPKLYELLAKRINGMTVHAANFSVFDRTLDSSGDTYEFLNQYCQQF